jgi:outer membrane protein
MRKRFLPALSVSTMLFACPICSQTVLLSPQSMVDYAVKNNAQVQSLRYNTQIEEYSRREATASFFPAFKVRASGTRLDKTPQITMYGVTQDMGTQDNWDIGLSITQPIFVGGKLLNAYRASDYNYRGSVLMEQRVDQIIKVAALQLFWSYVGIGESIKVMNENIAWLDKMAANQTMLTHEGLMLESDLLKMKSQLALLKLNEKRMENAAISLDEQIHLFCKISSNSSLVVDSTSLLVLGKDVYALTPDVEKIINNRKDVCVLLMQLNALQAFRKAQVGAYLPSLVGIFNYDIKNSALKADSAVPGWSLTAALDWTIFDWGAAYRQIQKTDCRIAQLKLAVESKKDSIKTELSAATRTILENIEAQQLALESVDNAQQVLTIAEMKYKEGLITSTDLLSASKDLALAKQELTKARIDRALALEQYKLAAGEW